MANPESLNELAETERLNGNVIDAVALNPEGEMHEAESAPT
jgi:hypothetical protein